MRVLVTWSFFESSGTEALGKRCENATMTKHGFEGRDKPGQTWIRSTSKPRMFDVGDCGPPQPRTTRGWRTAAASPFHLPGNWSRSGPPTAAVRSIELVLKR